MVRNAMLRHDSRQTPDPIRIVGIATAIAVNLAIFAVLMQPMGLTLPKPQEDNLTSVFVDPTPPRPKPPEPVTITKQPQQPHPLTTHTPHPTVRPPVLTPDNTSTSTAPPVDLGPTSPDPGPTADPGPPQPPVMMSLSPVESPPPAYPFDLLRDSVTGTVQLELLVGVDGRVIRVDIVHSSGNRELDKAAHDQVLRNWRFKPAMRDGVAVQALGRVPIVFTLDGR